MKQIKVPLTPREWADKRFQIFCANPACLFSELDETIERIGFELIESEKKPDFKRCGEGDNLCKCKSEKECGYLPEIPTDKVEAVKYFLNQLPEGYRERALEQLNESYIDIVPLNVEDALNEFTDWRFTKEGIAFWGKVHNHYEYPEEYPTLPPLPNE